jgi:hypothetical protein
MLMRGNIKESEEDAMANSTKRCKECKAWRPVELLIKHPIGTFCDDNDRACVIAFTQKAQNRARVKQQAKVKRGIKDRQKADRAKHRADKERVKSMAEWFCQLQKLVNQYVVHARDKNAPCCTCGTTNPIKYDAGHYRSRGACKELRFELTNIHKQCSVRCNQHGSGMRAEYREFITRKYGADRLEWLDGPHPLLKDQFPHYEDVKKEILRYRRLLRDNGVRPNA